MAELPENLNINYRPDVDILFCRFVRPVGSAQLKKGYENALQVARQNQVSFWLFDLRRRGPARQEDEKWLLDHFFPRLEANSPSRRNFFAYLVSPTHYAHVRDTIGLERLENYSSLIRIKIFDSEDNAFNWLTDNQVIPV